MSAEQPSHQEVHSTEDNIELPSGYGFWSSQVWNRTYPSLPTQEAMRLAQKIAQTVNDHLPFRRNHENQSTPEQSITP